MKRTLDVPAAHPEDPQRLRSISDALALLVENAYACDARVQSVLHRLGDAIHVVHHRLENCVDLWHDRRPGARRELQLQWLLGQNRILSQSRNARRHADCQCLLQQQLLLLVLPRLLKALQLTGLLRGLLRHRR